jgi:hypothetical protein
MLRMGVSVGCGNRSDAGIVSSTLHFKFQVYRKIIASAIAFPKQQKVIRLPQGFRG